MALVFRESHYHVIIFVSDDEFDTIFSKCLVLFGDLKDLLYLKFAIFT